MTSGSQNDPDQLAPRPVIRAVGHLTLRTTDIGACVDFAEQVMGLTAIDTTSAGVSLTCGDRHYALRYIEDSVNALDHMGFEATDAAALQEIRRRLTAAGIDFDLIEDEDLFADGIRTVMPGGFTIEIYTSMKPYPRHQTKGGWYGEQNVPGVRPSRFGHLTWRVEDPGPNISFLKEILDFRISDEVGGGAFLRCNVDHHGVAALPGDTKLHHHAWEVQSISELGRVCDRLHEYGSRVLLGPVRHGVGNNIAVYFEDPCGSIVEYYADMQRIYDDTDHVPGRWDDDTWYSIWTLMMPDGFKEGGVAPRNLLVPDAS